jgi:RNA polymerase sigma-70 factor (TIGR02943 family)
MATAQMATEEVIVHTLAAPVIDIEPWAGSQALATCSDTVASRARSRPADFASHRPALKRYAMRALRNPADAEDVVQETLAAALASPDGFGGRSSTLTWLIGILKHKILDTYRRQSREAPLPETLDGDALDDGDALFTPAGHWREAPANWGNPEVALAQRDFLQVLETCIASLPERMARAFTMREVLELEVGEICDALDISPNHCFVMLHRARMKLRLLLEQHWFGPQST